MSLYTLSSTDERPYVKPPLGLQMKECMDVSFLSVLCNLPVEEVSRRFAEYNRVFVAYINDDPAAFGWVAERNARIGELNHDFAVPPAHSYLWNFRTLEAYRGLGIYPALLQYIIRYSGTNNTRFWIAHAPENRSSLNGIVKAGFQYIGKLHLNNASMALEPTRDAEKYGKALAFMNMRIADEKSVACWNCSSPFLKNRSSECCCLGTNGKCTSNAMIALAS